VSSVPRKRVRASSSCLWSSWVPQMNRTEASPKPHSSSAAAHADVGALRRGQDALGLLEAGGPDLPELLGQRRFDRVARHACSLQSRMTLPVSPVRIAANASSNRSAGKRCVITGVMSRPLCSIDVIMYHVSYIWRP
jgi:hypothetical protein